MKLKIAKLEKEANKVREEEERERGEREQERNQQIEPVTVFVLDPYYGARRGIGQEGPAGYGKSKRRG